MTNHKVLHPIRIFSSRAKDALGKPILSAVYCRTEIDQVLELGETTSAHGIPHGTGEMQVTEILNGTEIHRSAANGDLKFYVAADEVEEDTKKDRLAVRDLHGEVFGVNQVKALLGDKFPGEFPWNRAEHFLMEDGVLQPYAGDEILPMPGIKINFELVE
jgi:hypothetical protein